MTAKQENMNITQTLLSCETKTLSWLSEHSLFIGPTELFPAVYI